MMNQCFPNVSKPCIPLSFALFSLILISQFSSPAHASTGKQYLSKRFKSYLDRRLTYQAVSANPSAYVGNVIELKGVVGGSVGGNDSLVSILLNLANQDSVMLDIPANEMGVLRDVENPEIRALVQIREGATGNVVPLRVIALVRESAIHTEELTIMAKEEANRQTEARRRREDDRWQRQTQKAFRSRSSRSLLPAVPTQTMSFASSSAFPSLSQRAQPLFDPYLKFISHHNPKLTSDQAGKIAFHLLNFADRYNVDPRLVVSMIIAESDFDPNCVSRTGAIGLGQLMPATARELGVNNSFDPVQNLAGSIAYLKSRLDTFPDKAAPGGTYSFQQVAFAMAAYNAGTGAVKKFNGVPPYRETQAYVKRIINLYQQLCAGE